MDYAARLQLLRYIPEHTQDTDDAYIVGYNDLLIIQRANVLPVDNRWRGERLIRGRTLRVIPLNRKRTLYRGEIKARRGQEMFKFHCQ